MSGLRLESAVTIAEQALKTGRDTDCEPLTVAVLDSGGHLVAFMREDRSGILRPDIAIGKAWGALGMGMPSRALHEKNERFLTALAAVSGGRMLPVPGGVLIKNTDGDIIGAVGISGDASHKDEACAIAGIHAAGLISDPESGAG
jgi:uncharacterized protein GlcG (DUF336 family)